MRRWRNACLVLMALALAAAAWLWVAAPLPERPEHPRSWERMVENADWARDRLGNIYDLVVLSADSVEIATLVVADEYGIAVVSGDHVRRVLEGASVRGLTFLDTTRGWAVGSSGSIFSTEDGGNTWIERAAAKDVFFLFGVDFVDAQRGWAVGEKGTILSTTDGGISWARQDSNSIADLSAVSFVDSLRGWAVGEGGTILNTTDGGASWERIYSPAAGAFVRLNSLHFINGTLGWTVGDDGTILATSDGGETWSEQSVNISADLENVHFFDALRGWAVGSMGTILATTDSGKTWRVQSSGTRSGFSAVHFVDEMRGWAVGASGAIAATNNNGERWTTRVLDSEDSLDSVHFIDARNGWAVGEMGTILATNDGGTWWAVQASSTAAWLRSVHFVNARRGWAVGDSGTILTTSDAGITWTPQSSGTTAFLSDVYFIDELRGWVVGWNGIILATSDGGKRWSVQLSGTASFLQAVQFIDALRGWAVGTSGTILTSGNGGATWIAQASGTETSLNAVHIVDAEHGWVVGDDGTILDTSDGGTRWTRQLSGTNVELTAVQFIDLSRGWAFGDGGTIISTSDGGASWTSEASGTQANLEAAQFLDQQLGWTVGEEGTIQSTGDGGNSWSAIRAVVSTWIENVHFFDDQLGSVVGDEGTILVSSDSGVHWLARTSGTRAVLLDSHFISSQRGWVVGDEGTILLTTNGGISWIEQLSSTRAPLAGLDFINDRQGWAVGHQGTILSTTDGGTHWISQSSGIEATLYAVCFKDFLRGWVVGDEGTILLTTDGGESWVAQISGTSVPLLDVYFVDREAGWAVGSAGTILSTRDGGASWVAQTSGTRASLNALRFVDSLRGWAVGEAGTILLTADGGATWRQRPSPSPAPLHGLSVLPDGRTLWAVGPYTIIKSTDGGETWESVSPMRVELPSGLYWLLGAAGGLLLMAIALSRVPERSDRVGEVESDAAISSAKQDRLRAQQQAERLAAFFNHVGTNPPLTLAINGPWGSGKSSLMNLLARELRLDGFRPVWINLWHQQDEAQLYTNLVKAIRADGIAPWWLTSGLLLRLSLALRRAGPWVLLAGATAVVFVFSLHPPRWQDTDTWHAPLIRPWVSFATAAQDAWEAGKARRITVGAPWLDGLSAFHGFDQRPDVELSVDRRLAQAEQQKRDASKPARTSLSSDTAAADAASERMAVGRDDLVQATLRPVWGRQFAHLDELLVELHKDSPCSARTRPDSGLGAQLSCPQFQQAIEWLVRAHACKTGMQTCQSNVHRLAGWQTGVASLAHQSTRLSAGPGHEWPAVMGLFLALLAFVPQFRALPGDYRNWYAKLRSSFGGMPEGDPGLRHRFARGLSQLARHMQRRPLVIFFDDLDRLDGKRTLEFLECLNFLSTDHRAGYYIVGMDYERVVHTLAPVFAEEVKAKYGAADAETLRQSQIRHARRYLHKLIHVVHTLPSANSAEVLAPPDTQAPAQLSLRGALRRWLHQRRGALRRGFEVAGPLLLLMAAGLFWLETLDGQAHAPRPTSLAALGTIAPPSQPAATPLITPVDPSTVEGTPEAPPEPGSSGFAVPDRSIENAPLQLPIWLLAVFPLMLLGLLFVYRLSTRRLQDPVSVREAYHRWFQLLAIETPRDAKRLANAIRVEAGLSRELLLDEDKEAGQKQIQQTIELVALASLEVLRQRMGERKFRWGSKVRAAADETSKDLKSPLQMMGQTERSQAIARVLRYSSLGA